MSIGNLEPLSPPDIFRVIEVNPEETLPNGGRQPQEGGTTQAIGVPQRPEGGITSGNDRELSGTANLDLGGDENRVFAEGTKFFDPSDRLSEGVVIGPEENYALLIDYEASPDETSEGQTVVSFSNLEIEYKLGKRRIIKASIRDSVETLPVDMREVSFSWSDGIPSTDLVKLERYFDLNQQTGEVTLKEGIPSRDPFFQGLDLSIDITLDQGARTTFTLEYNANPDSVSETPGVPETPGEATSPSLPGYTPGSGEARPFPWNPEIEVSEEEYMRLQFTPVDLFPGATEEVGSGTISSNSDVILRDVDGVPPSELDEKVTVTADSPAFIRVGANNPNLDILSLNAHSSSKFRTENGTIRYDGPNNYIYTPDIGFSGTDKFVYRVGESDFATVTIEVQTELPLATDDFVDVYGGQTDQTFSLMNEFENPKAFEATRVWLKNESSGEWQEQKLLSDGDSKKFVTRHATYEFVDGDVTIDANRASITTEELRVEWTDWRPDGNNLVIESDLTVNIGDFWEAATAVTYDVLDFEDMLVVRTKESVILDELEQPLNSIPGQVLAGMTPDDIYIFEEFKADSNAASGFSETAEKTEIDLTNVNLPLSLNLDEDLTARLLGVAIETAVNQFTKNQDEVFNGRSVIGGVTVDAEEPIQFDLTDPDEAKLYNTLLIAGAAAGVFDAPQKYNRGFVSEGVIDESRAIGDALDMLWSPELLNWRSEASDIVFNDMFGKTAEQVHAEAVSFLDPSTADGRNFLASLDGMSDDHAILVTKAMSNSLQAVVSFIPPSGHTRSLQGVVNPDLIVNGTVWPDYENQNNIFVKSDTAAPDNSGRYDAAGEAIIKVVAERFGINELEPDALDDSYIDINLNDIEDPALLALIDDLESGDLEALLGDASQQREVIGEAFFRLGRTFFQLDFFDGLTENPGKLLSQSYQDAPTIAELRAFSENFADGFLEAYSASLGQRSGNFIDADADLNSAFDAGIQRGINSLPGGQTHHQSFYQNTLTSLMSSNVFGNSGIGLGRGLLVGAVGVGVPGMALSAGAVFNDDPTHNLTMSAWLLAWGSFATTGVVDDLFFSPFQRPPAAATEIAEGLDSLNTYHSSFPRGTPSLASRVPGPSDPVNLGTPDSNLGRLRRTFRLDQLDPVVGTRVHNWLRGVGIPLDSIGNGLAGIALAMRAASSDDPITRGRFAAMSASIMTGGVLNAVGHGYDIASNFTRSPVRAAKFARIAAPLRALGSFFGGFTSMGFFLADWVSGTQNQNRFIEIFHRAQGGDNGTSHTNYISDEFQDVIDAEGLRTMNPNAVGFGTAAVGFFGAPFGHGFINNNPTGDSDNSHENVTPGTI